MMVLGFGRAGKKFAFQLGCLPRAAAATVTFQLRRNASYKGKVALVRPEDEIYYHRVAVLVERV